MVSPITGAVVVWNKKGVGSLELIWGQLMTYLGGRRPSATLATRRPRRRSPCLCHRNCPRDSHFSQNGGDLCPDQRCRGGRRHVFRLGVAEAAVIPRAVENHCDGTLAAERQQSLLKLVRITASDDRRKNGRPIDLDVRFIRGPPSLESRRDGRSNRLNNRYRGCRSSRPRRPPMNHGLRPFRIAAARTRSRSYRTELIRRGTNLKKERTHHECPGRQARAAPGRQV